MSERIKKKWLVDNTGQKVTPYTLLEQVVTSEGERFDNEYEKDKVASYASYNLIQGEAESVDNFYGVKITANNDGSYTLNGTFTSGTQQSYQIVNNLIPRLESGKSYYLFGNLPEIGGSNKFRLIVGDSSSRFNMDDGQGKAFEGDSLLDRKVYFLFKQNGMVFDNVTIYPQLVAVEDKEMAKRYFKPSGLSNKNITAATEATMATDLSYEQGAREEYKKKVLKAMASYYVRVRQKINGSSTNVALLKAQYLKGNIFVDSNKQEIPNIIRYDGDNTYNTMFGRYSTRIIPDLKFDTQTSPDTRSLYQIGLDCSTFVTLCTHGATFEDVFIPYLSDAVNNNFVDSAKFKRNVDVNITNTTEVYNIDYFNSTYTPEMAMCSYFSEGGLKELYSRVVEVRNGTVQQPSEYTFNSELYKTLQTGDVIFIGDDSNSSGINKFLYIHHCGIYLKNINELKEVVQRDYPGCEFNYNTDNFNTGFIKGDPTLGYICQCIGTAPHLVIVPLDDLILNPHENKGPEGEGTFTYTRKVYVSSGIPNVNNSSLMNKLSKFNLEVKNLSVEGSFLRPSGSAPNIDLNLLNYNGQWTIKPREDKATVAISNSYNNFPNGNLVISQALLLNFGFDQRFGGTGGFQLLSYAYSGTQQVWCRKYTYSSTRLIWSAWEKVLTSVDMKTIEDKIPTSNVRSYILTNSTTHGAENPPINKINVTFTKKANRMVTVIVAGKSNVTPGLYTITGQAAGETSIGTIAQSDKINIEKSAYYDFSISRASGYTSDIIVTLIAENANALTITTEAP